MFDFGSQGKTVAINDKLTRARASNQHHPLFLTGGGASRLLPGIVADDDAVDDDDDDAAFAALLPVTAPSASSLCRTSEAIFVKASTTLTFDIADVSKNGILYSKANASPSDMETAYARNIKEKQLMCDLLAAVLDHICCQPRLCKL